MSILKRSIFILIILLINNLYVFSNENLIKSAKLDINQKYILILDEKILAIKNFNPEILKIEEIVTIENEKNQLVLVPLKRGFNEIEILDSNQRKSTFKFFVAFEEKLFPNLLKIDFCDLKNPIKFKIPIEGLEDLDLDFPERRHKENSK